MLNTFEVRIIMYFHASARRPENSHAVSIAELGDTCN